jgi:hypothetical protein
LGGNHHLTPTLQHLQPGLGQTQLPRGPLQQRHAHGALQPRHLPAHGRWRQTMAPRRRRKAARLGHPHEGHQFVHHFKEVICSHGAKLLFWLQV